MNRAYIALGSNLGDRAQFIQDALNFLSEDEEITLCRVSSLHETLAVSIEVQPQFLNAVCEIITSYSARRLLTLLQDIEMRLGREEKGLKKPRTIDLDLLFYNNQVINEEDFILPHPHLHQREFVLKPLCELNSTLIHPLLGKDVYSLLGSINL